MELVRICRPAHNVYKAHMESKRLLPAAGARKLRGTGHRSSRFRTVSRRFAAVVERALMNHVNCQFDREEASFEVYGGPLPVLAVVGSDSCEGKNPMRNVIPLATLACLAVALVRPAVGSVTETLNDTVSVWGYDLDGTIALGNDGNYWGKGSSPSPSKDVHGIPEFFDSNGGTVTLNDGRNTLQSIEISYSNPEHGDSAYANLWQILKPGDLFLDFGNDGTWDAVGRTPFYAQQDYYSADSDGNRALFDANTWDLYELGDPVEYYRGRAANNGVFQLASESGRADRDGVQDWTGVQERGYHPWAMDSSYLDANGEAVGTITFDGWKNLSGVEGPATSTWTFDNGGYALPFHGDKLGIGWGVNCANEVGYAVVDVTAIPEPASLAIWGLLGVGVFVWRTRRKHRAA